jgi:hypothetical protein
MHPDDQAFVDRLPAQVAKLRERFPERCPKNPSSEWEDEQGIAWTPRRDHPDFSPTTQEKSEV